ncbi:MAG: hypothetical protein PF447_06480 [Spirochaetaceae bacterium]|jgi:hypothetical protein|nr:hypothetical protein [Spirochaetaceae bacterium]
MKRLEIMVNSSLEVDVMEILEHIESKGYFTKLNNVHGTGSSGPRRGDHIWPEENTLFIIYEEDDICESIILGLNSIKERYPDVGLKYFILNI